MHLTALDIQKQTFSKKFKGFNVDEVPNPLEGSNVFKPSGRGVFLINQLMDTDEYSDEGRRVVMRKRIDAKA